MHKRQKIGVRPAYYDGQLLQAKDFIDEQRYHIHARRRHTAALHGWGVVRGLEARASGDASITVQPGFAVDRQGRELEIEQPFTLELSGFAPLSRLRITLEYGQEAEAERQNRNRIESRAVLTASDDPDDPDTLLLATLQLDGEGRINVRTIDTGAARRMRTPITAGSVGVSALDESLRLGWLRLPMRGVPLERGPHGEDAIPPPFRIGTTEARSHSEWLGKANHKGAGGTMPIPIPMGALRVLRFRIAGTENDGGIDFHLVRGGFDKDANRHDRKILLEKSITGRPYNEVYTIDDGDLDPEYHTLSLWVHGHAKVSVSLVALQFSY
jgi:hypothetical protein